MAVIEVIVGYIVNSNIETKIESHYGMPLAVQRGGTPPPWARQRWAPFFSEEVDLL